MVTFLIYNSVFYFQQLRGARRTFWSQAERVSFQVLELPHAEGARAQAPFLLLCEWLLGNAHLELDAVEGVGENLWKRLVIIRLGSSADYILKLGE